MIAWYINIKIECKLTNTACRNKNTEYTNTEIEQHKHRNKVDTHEINLQKHQNGVHIENSVHKHRAHGYRKMSTDYTKVKIEYRNAEPEYRNTEIRVHRRTKCRLHNNQKSGVQKYKNRVHKHKNRVQKHKSRADKHNKTAYKNTTQYPNMKIPSTQTQKQSTLT